MERSKAGRRAMSEETRPAAVVCSSKIFSLTRHLLATAEALDGKRSVHQSLGTYPAKTRQPAGDRLGPGDGRCHVFPGEKGGDGVGPTKKGKGTKLMVLVDGDGVPLAVDMANGSTSEVKLIESLLEQRVHPRLPRRLIYDRAADCDGLRQRLTRRGIELITPHRRGRKRPVTQDGRALRRYRHRWKIERTISWLQNYRRLVTRYEVHVHLFLGFAQLAALLTTFKRL